MGTTDMNQPCPGDHPSKWCLGCFYILDGLKEQRCPECGRRFDPEDPLTYSFNPWPKQLSMRLRKALAVAGLPALLAPCLSIIFDISPWEAVAGLAWHLLTGQGDELWTLGLLGLPFFVPLFIMHLDVRVCLAPRISWWERWCCHIIGMICVMATTWCLGMYITEFIRYDRELSLFAILLMGTLAMAPLGLGFLYTIGRIILPPHITPRLALLIAYLSNAFTYMSNFWTFWQPGVYLALWLSIVYLIQLVLYVRLGYRERRENRYATYKPTPVHY